MLQRNCVKNAYILTVSKVGVSLFSRNPETATKVGASLFVVFILSVSKVGVSLFSRNSATSTKVGASLLVVFYFFREQGGGFPLLTEFCDCNQGGGFRLFCFHFSGSPLSTQSRNFNRGGAYLLIVCIISFFSRDSSTANKMEASILVVFITVGGPFLHLKNVEIFLFFHFQRFFSIF